MKRYNSMTYPYDDMDIIRQPMKRYIMRIYFSSLIILLLTACTPALPFEPAQTSTPTFVNPTESDLSPMPQNPTLNNLETLIGTAKQDLAGRLSIPVNEIILLDAKDVIWSNSSLGCPQPGMVYADILTPGYLILLNVNNKDYEYHAGKSSDVFLCENPTPPVPGMSGDT